MAEVKVAFEAKLKHADELLKSKDYEAAATVADELLLSHRLTKLAQAALVRGKALVATLLAQIMDEEKESPRQEDFGEVWDCFMLALRLDPHSAEAQTELAKLQSLIAEMPTE